MRRGRSTSFQLAAWCSVPLLPAVAAAGTGPAYNIYPMSPIGSDTLSTGQGVSTSGAFATGYTQRTGGSNGFLYDVSSGTSTIQSQAGVTYGSGTVENYGAPYSVNNQGIMFGSSGAASAVQTGAATVFDGGQAYNLQLPLYFGAGQVYGSNNYNASTLQSMAVGSIGTASGGLNQAALFRYYGSGSSFTSVLSQKTSNGGSLQAAYGINDAQQIVGTSINPNNAAIVDGFFLDLGAGNATATVIPTSSSTYNTTQPFAISSNGLVVGSESLYTSTGQPFLYNNSSGTTVQLPLVHGASSGGARGVNSSGEVVGTQSGTYALPYLYDGSNAYLLSTLLANNAAGAWHLSDNTSSGAFGIADNGAIVGRAMYNGVLTGFVMVPANATITTPRELTFNNAGGGGNGSTWDSIQPNFNDGTGPTTFNGVAGDYVTFSDANSGHYIVNLPATVTPTSVTVNASGNYVFAGAGGIGGGSSLTTSGTGTLTLATANTYTGPTNVFGGGSLVLAAANALPKGTNLSVTGTGTTLVASPLSSPYALQVGTIYVYTGTVNLTTNALVVHSGSLSSVTSLVKAGYNGGAWNGSSGIATTSAGAAGSTRALGVILNDTGAGTKTPLYGVGGAIAATFVGSSTPVDGDILVAFTYYGDANLDGKVDGSDYTRIDAGLASQTTTTKLTGWYNGDFNYDGKIDGSDYTLIDNAYNAQPAPLRASGIAAASTAELAAVPEPGILGLFGSIAALAVARRRRV